ncbi:hypothetical protein INR49_026721 [Caranx melampygus]|nr:hypothetical protein INR49_026721 [Caranx melampygus]
MHLQQERGKRSSNGSSRMGRRMEVSTATPNLPSHQSFPSPSLPPSLSLTLLSSILLCLGINLPGTSRQRKIPNMAPKVELPNAAAMVWLLVLCLIPPVEAYDTGDAIALLLGTVLAVVGFCSCLGWYARRRNEQL